MNTATNIPSGNHNRKPGGMVAGFPVSSDLRAGVVPDAPDCH
jgi:hypothetical protein